MLHQLITTWFAIVNDWGYLGIFLLMALESSLVPVPSEVVMPPAAFWAAQGRMDFWMVVLMGTIGSYVGSAINYWAARWLGGALVKRFGRYVLITPEKLELAQNWVNRFGLTGIFLARLLPVIRHIISIPAGICKMNFLKFSIVTTVGAGLWCFILSWFGQKALGAHPELLQSPADMVNVIKQQMGWFVGGVAVVLALYFFVVWQKNTRKPNRKGVS